MGARQACQICNGSTTHELGCRILVLPHPEPCALLLTRPRRSAGRHQEKGFALRSSRMRTAVACLHGPNSAVCTVAASQVDFFAMRWMMTGRGSGFEDYGHKPDNDEGDDMIVAGAASAIGATSIEGISSSASRFPANFASSCISSVLDNFTIARPSPASALSTAKGGNAPSCN